MTLPTIYATGRLGQDPELRFTPQGKAVANFSIACSDNKKVDGEWKEMGCTWLRCTVWDQAAESLVESVGKGDELHVTGRLKCRVWEDKEGNKRESWEVDVQSVSVVVRRNTVTVNRASRGESSRVSEEDPWSTPAEPENAPF